MTITEFILFVQFVFFAYFVLINGTYLTLSLIAAVRLWRTMQEREADYTGAAYTGLEPAISLVVPAHNEETTIASSVHSLLQLDYPDFEIVIVNDGSADHTLDVLIDEFRFVKFPESGAQTLTSQPVRQVYHSTKYQNLRLIDKENGGKADSLNAGLNVAQSPLYCCLDADSILQRDSLRQLVKPFLDDGRTVATGGTVRIANGCVVRNGILVQADLPNNFLALLQIVEYMRAFLFGRLGWVPMNGMLVISGAIGLFDKARVLEVGGYRTDTVGEDMELVVRLHHYLSTKRIPYLINFVANPVCWTEAPEDLESLQQQRVRWQRGLCESLMANRKMMMSPGSGPAGWLAFPFMMIFEMLGPFIEVVGYIFMIVLWILGLVNTGAFLIFILLAMGLGLLLSVSAILLEEMSFHIYPKPIHVVKMFGIAFLDNLGYRQLNSVWRLMGLFKWMVGTRGNWGKVVRKGTWNKTFKWPVGLRRKKAVENR